MRLSGRSAGLPASWDASFWVWAERIRQSVKATTAAGCGITWYGFASDRHIRSWCACAKIRMSCKTRPSCRVDAVVIMVDVAAAAGYVSGNVLGKNEASGSLSSHSLSHSHSHTRSKSWAAPQPRSERHGSVGAQYDERWEISAARPGRSLSEYGQGDMGRPAWTSRPGCSSQDATRARVRMGRTGMVGFANRPRTGKFLGPRSRLRRA